MKRLAVLLALLVLAACTTLPESGEVHRFTGPHRATTSEAPYFLPPGPTEGASPEQIVQGFLDAMVANPISIGTARSFLTEQAASTWRPNGGTLIYEASTIEQTPRDVLARLSDAHRLDARGSWTSTPTRTESLHLSVVRENGQWRIDNPPDALVVKSSFFQSQFVPFTLYFYDHAGRVLVPDLVYIPRGEQTATTLVRSLLSGPDPRLAPVVRSAFPANTDLDLSVAVTESGVAEVPLSAQVLKLSPGELQRAMIQLAWTLRPVPGINRVRITVAGTPVPLADGRTDLSVDEGPEYAATGLGTSRELLAIRDGHVVTVSGERAEPVTGALGRRGYALRSLALDRAGDRLAAVSANGHKVYVADKSDATVPVSAPFSAGADLLRPSFDLFGALWLVDRTPRGAVVHVVEQGHDRVVPFPGISGRQVGSFAVSPDGTRLAVTLTGGATPRVEVADIVRGPAGAVLRGLQPGVVPVTTIEPEHDLGRAVDIGWRSPTMLAVLTRPGPALSRVVYAPADGSPGNGEPTDPDAFTGAARTLLVNADTQLPLMLIDDRGRLTGLDAAGKWAGTSLTRLAGAAYAS